MRKLYASCWALGKASSVAFTTCPRPGIHFNSQPVMWYSARSWVESIGEASLFCVNTHTHRKPMAIQATEPRRKFSQVNSYSTDLQMSCLKLLHACGKQTIQKIFFTNCPFKKPPNGQPWQFPAEVLSQHSSNIQKLGGIALFSSSMMWKVREWEKMEDQTLAGGVAKTIL